MATFFRYFDEIIIKYNHHELYLTGSISYFFEKEINVLIEKQGLGVNRLTGRSSYLQSVHMDGDPSFIGEIVKAKIIKTRDNSLEGIIL